MKQTIAILLFILVSVSSTAQGVKEESKVREVLNSRGEAKIWVWVAENDLDDLGNTVSIDAKKGDKWLCYVNEREFDNFLTMNLPYQAYIEDNQSKALTMANAVSEMSSWNRYPTYEVYDTMMRYFASAYPQLCRLDTIGTTIQGRLLLCLKISDSVNETQNEPKFFYSSSMHGDELTGAIMLLRLAEYLLSNYDSDSRIARIVNGIELYLCPLANPDGTYHVSNSSVSGATRSNANYIDLNRNYPSPKRGNHPDGNNWQSETLAFIEYAKSKEFDLNINMHGGAEVCNYPFDDILPSNVKSHADNQWFVEMSQRFMDTLWYYAPSYYFTDVSSSGYILGYDWYPISGSRQDYHCYFLHQREITLEVSSTKSPSSSSLPTYWTYLRSPLLCFVEECFSGVNGVVKDSLTGETIDNVFIYLSNHDRDSSQIYSKANGYFFRPLHNGQYSLTFEKQGYVPKTLNFNLQQNNLIYSDVLLVSTNALNEAVQADKTLTIYPNPSSSQINVRASDDGSFFIANLTGKRLMEGELRRGDNLIDVKQRLENGYYCFVFTIRENGRTITKPLIILNK
jgi:hypothetical protein